MALVIAFAALAAVAVLLGVLARVEERLLADPEIREASRPAPMTSRAVAARACEQAMDTPGPAAAPQHAPGPGAAPQHAPGPGAAPLPAPGPAATPLPAL